MLAGDGADIEGQAARDAMSDVVDELYADADTWEELEATAVTPEDIRRLLTMFLARYVYNRLPVLAEGLARLMDPAAARDADRQIIEMVRDLVVLRLLDDPLAFDWRGPEGRSFAEDAVRDVYTILEAFGGDTP